MSVRTIGRHSYVGTGDVSTDVTVGSYTSIAPGVRMNHRIQHPCVDDPLLVSTYCLSGYPPPSVKHGITIGSDVWIGRDAVLLAPITIGHGAIIGAFSVVAKDIPPYAVVVGNPAQVIRYRFDPETVARLLTMQWWDWPEAVIAERAADLRDVGVLVTKYGYEVAP